MLSKIIKGILLIIMLVMLAYAGTCAYVNFIAKPPSAQEVPAMPKVEEAIYYCLIQNTGTVILTNQYEQFGDQAGERSFILHGYWEQAGAEFKFRSNDIILSEKVFGEITIGRRNQ